MPRGETAGLGRADACMLCSLAVEFRITQNVDGQRSTGTGRAPHAAQVAAGPSALTGARAAPQPFLIRLTSACVKAVVLALPPRSPVRTLSRLKVASMATRSRVANSVSLQ
ncbi:hypothetical protein BH11PSE10_BH11PSE10_15410 [soil metagenome]